MEDAKIIEQIRDGKPQLFDELIKKYYGNIYCYCYRHVSNKQVSEDLTQDVFIKVIKSIDRYKHYGKFENYLYVIARNICKDFYKKKKDVYLEEIKIQSEENQILLTEDKVFIQQALQTLPEVEREVMILRYYHDLKFKDIAKIMRCTVSITKYRLNRAEKKLSRWSKEEMYYEESRA